MFKEEEIFFNFDDLSYEFACLFRKMAGWFVGCLRRRICSRLGMEGQALTHQINRSMSIPLRAGVKLKLALSCTEATNT